MNKLLIGDFRFMVRGLFLGMRRSMFLYLSRPMPPDSVGVVFYTRPQKILRLVIIGMPKN